MVGYYAGKLPRAGVSSLRQQFFIPKMTQTVKTTKTKIDLS